MIDLGISCLSVFDKNITSCLAETKEGEPSSPIHTFEEARLPYAVHGNQPRLHVASS